MAEKTFDISIAIDEAEYLNPQLYMFASTLKDKMPDGTILHLVTNRSLNDPVIEYINENINTKLYKKPTFNNLKSRCKYLLRAVEVDTKADYLIRMDVDILPLRHLDCIDELLKHNFQMYIQGENRRIIKNDNLELRIWRQIYKAMNIDMPDWKISYVENHEKGRPLLNTGLMFIRNDVLKTIRERWSKLTKICERWINLGIHPNEFAMTALIIDEGWTWGGLTSLDSFNPIGHYRKGNFPSIELVDDCKLPDDVTFLHYHRPQWLMHLANYNKNIENIVCENSKWIPNEWWTLPTEKFMEG